MDDIQKMLEENKEKEFLKKDKAFFNLIHRLIFKIYGGGNLRASDILRFISDKLLVCGKEVLSEKEYKAYVDRVLGISRTMLLTPEKKN